MNTTTEAKANTNTSHCESSEITRCMRLLNISTTTAIINSTTFFPKVCQLFNAIASPKQPQSLIGLVNAKKRVSGVITVRKTIIDHR